MTKPEIWTKPKFFSDTKYFWYRIRYFFDTNFFPIPIPILFSIPKFFETNTETFSDTKFFSKPIPILFSIPKKFETDTNTFIDTKIFRNRYRYYQKQWKSFEIEKFQNQNVTLWFLRRLSFGDFWPLLPRAGIYCMIHSASGLGKSLGRWGWTQYSPPLCIYSFFQILFRHEKMNREGSHCKSDPNYSFSSCVKQSISNKLGCKLPWDQQSIGIVRVPLIVASWHPGWEEMENLRGNLRIFKEVWGNLSKFERK